MSNSFVNDVYEFKIAFWTTQTIIILKNQTKNKIAITQTLKSVKISSKWINANKKKRQKLKSIWKNNKFNVEKFRANTIMHLSNAWSYYQLILFAISLLTNILKILINEKRNVSNNENRTIAFKTIKNIFSTFEFHQIKKIFKRDYFLILIIVYWQSNKSIQMLIEKKVCY